VKVAFRFARLAPLPLRDAEQLSRARLSQATGGDQLVELHRKLYTQLPFTGVRETEIDEHVAGSGVNRLTLPFPHNGSRNPLVTADLEPAPSAAR
jgi:hypothetical protein